MNIVTRSWATIFAFVMLLIVVLSTKAFYSLLFVDPRIHGPLPPCAVVVSNGGPIAESAMLASSVKRLGIGDLYVLSMQSDPTIPDQLDSFFMNRQGFTYLDAKALTENRFRTCIFSFPPEVYCSMIGIQRKYTLLPHEVAPFLPSARFLDINIKTLAHCMFDDSPLLAFTTQ